MKLRMFTSLSTSGSKSKSKSGSKSKSKSLTSSASSSASAILIFLVASQFLTNSNVVNAFVIGSSRSARSRINAVADQRGPLMKLKHQSYHASYSQSLLVNDKRKSSCSCSSSSRNVLVLKLSSDINNNKDDDDDDKTKKEPVEDYDNFDYTPFLEGKKVQSSSSETDTDTDAAVTTDVVDSMPLSSSSLSSSSLKDNINNDNDNSNILTLDESIQTRYACTRYKRYDGNYTSDRNPSTSNPDVVKKARSALQLAIRSPSGFNVQPYKMLMINTPSAKLKLSKYCIGRNIDRVLDSDCTVIFLADRQAMRSWKQYKSMIEDSSSPQPTSSAKGAKIKTKLNWLKLRILIGLFSSGYPYIPKIIAGPISWFVRTSMRIVSWFTRSWLVVPTLSSSECWSQKNTALVAMSYMLVCTSKQLVTTPMEGYLSWGIRQSFNISRRYTIPLIISTGTPYSTDTDTNDENDDTGISHGNTKETSTPRFAYDSIIYEK